MPSGGCRTVGDMFDREAERDDQTRRTTAARRGVRIAGVVGATGAAVAIGVTTSVAHAGTDDTNGSTTSRHQPAPADPEDESSEDGEDHQRARSAVRSPARQTWRRWPLPGPLERLLTTPTTNQARTTTWTRTRPSSTQHPPLRPGARDDRRWRCRDVAGCHRWPRCRRGDWRDLGLECHQLDERHRRRPRRIEEQPLEQQPGDDRQRLELASDHERLVMTATRDWEPVEHGVPPGRHRPVGARGRIAPRRRGAGPHRGGVQPLPARQRADDPCAGRGRHHPPEPGAERPHAGGDRRGP